MTNLELAKQQGNQSAPNIIDAQKAGELDFSLNISDEQGNQAGPDLLEASADLLEPEDLELISQQGNQCMSLLTDRLAGSRYSTFSLGHNILESCIGGIDEALYTPPISILPTSSGLSLEIIWGIDPETDEGVVYGNGLAFGDPNISYDVDYGYLDIEFFNWLYRSSSCEEPIIAKIMVDGIERDRVPVALTSNSLTIVSDIDSIGTSTSHQIVVEINIEGN